MEPIAPVHGLGFSVDYDDFHYKSRHFPGPPSRYGFQGPEGFLTSRSEDIILYRPSQQLMSRITFLRFAVGKQTTPVASQEQFAHSLQKFGKHEEQNHSRAVYAS